MTPAMMQPYDIRPAIKALADIARTNLAVVGSGAQLVATAAGGAVTGVTVVAGGSGYPPYVRLVFAAAGSDAGGGQRARALAVVTSGAVATVEVLDGGSGYTEVPTVSVAPYLNVVYPEVPRVFSDGAPVMFFEYRGGANERDAYGAQGASSTRTWEVDAIALQCLAKEPDQADRMTQEFVGVFYDLVRDNSTLADPVANPVAGGLVDEAIVVRDDIDVFGVNGGQAAGVVFLANVFTVRITEFVE